MSGRQEADQRLGRVLIVDDDMVNTMIIQEILEDIYELKSVENGEAALACVETFAPDLILLDIMMPGMDGYEVCRHLKNNRNTEHIPIIFLTARITTESKVKGFAEGGADYVTKPFEPEELLARVKTHIQLRQALITIEDYNRNLEQLLEKRTKNLVKAERQAAFSLMIQGIVHNLKNSLTSILGGSQLMGSMIESLEEMEDLSESARKEVSGLSKFSEIVYTSAEQLNEMVGSMMTKSLSDKSEEVSCVDLNRILRQELDFLSADLKFSREVEKMIDLDRDYLPVRVVPSEIAQVFRNLIKNAVEAMWTQVDAAVVIRSYREASGMVGFSVTDNGPGVNQSIEDKIFDPFFSTKSFEADRPEGHTGGNGLGLHTCRELIRSYGGEITVARGADQGAVFSVTLPAAD